MSELLDNRANRIRTLKQIIKHLHAGLDPDIVRNQLKEIVQAVDATEIAQMEQELIAEGISPEEITSMCDLHSQVVRDIMVNPMMADDNPNNVSPSPHSGCGCGHGGSCSTTTPISHALEQVDPDQSQVQPGLGNIPLPVRQDLSIEEEIRAHLPNRGSQNEPKPDAAKTLADMQNNFGVNVLPGHPVDTFRRENDALSELMVNLKSALSVLCEAVDEDGNPCDPSTPTPSSKHATYHTARQHLNELMDIDKHYDRKENLLFSMLERHGINGPSTVMWAKDDQVRDLLKACGTNYLTIDATAEQWREYCNQYAVPALQSVVEMIFKEENILLPMSLKTLTATEWAQIWEQSPQFGWCLVDPQEGYIPPKFDAKLGGNTEGNVTDKKTGSVSLGITSPPVEGEEVNAANGAGRGSEQPSLTSAKKAKIQFGTGILTLEQLTAIFSTIPVDLTFVDAEDRVRFFSESPKRVFKRPKAVIGRLVHNCHPPHSVHIVEKILDDFKAGEQNVAEFWIPMGEKFVHIRYYALRDDDGAYMGTLEVTQDLTHERSLEGDRRLLSYD
ncbi:DUF438 domain-containing protein [Planctomycetota bacterium]|nr:DUF438 domain-containing protein [Planctomycetota bacterium]